MHAELHAGDVAQPCRQAAVVPLAADVGADAEDGVHAGVLDLLEEAHDVVAALEVVLPAARLVAVPEDVRLDGVQPALLGLPDQIRPHLQASNDRDLQFIHGN